MYVQTLNFLQILMVAFGLTGAGIAFYLYFRRPSLIIIPSVITASILLFILGQTLPFIWLANFGQSTYAEIIKVDCQSGKKHHIYYRFIVNAIPINDIGSEGYDNSMCNSIVAGDIGQVVYLSDDPKIHVWGHPSEYVGERIVAGLLIGIFLPIFSYFSVRKRIGV